MLAAYSPSLPRDNQWAKNKKNKHHGPTCRIPSNSHGQWMDGLDSNVSTATTGPSSNFVGFFSYHQNVESWLFVVFQGKKELLDSELLMQV